MSKSLSGELDKAIVAPPGGMILNVRMSSMTNSQKLLSVQVSIRKDDTIADACTNAISEGSPILRGKHMTQLEVEDLVAVINYDAMRAVRMNNKCMEQCKHEDTLYMITNAEWNDYKEYLLANGKGLKRHNKVYVAAHPNQLNVADLHHFIGQYNAKSFENAQKVVVDHYEKMLKDIREKQDMHESQLLNTHEESLLSIEETYRSQLTNLSMQLHDVQELLYGEKETWVEKMKMSEKYYDDLIDLTKDQQNEVLMKYEDYLSTDYRKQTELTHCCNEYLTKMEQSEEKSIKILKDCDETLNDLRESHNVEVKQLKAFYEKEMSDQAVVFDEKHNGIVDGHQASLEEQHKKHLEDFNEMQDRLRQEHSEQLEKHKQFSGEAQEEHKQTLEGVREEYERKLSSQRQDHLLECQNLKAKNENEIKAIRMDHEQVLREMKDTYDVGIVQIKQEHGEKLEQESDVFASKEKEMKAAHDLHIQEQRKTAAEELQAIHLHYDSVVSNALQEQSEQHDIVVQEHLERHERVVKSHIEKHENAVNEHATLLTEHKSKREQDMDALRQKHDELLEKEKKRVLENQSAMQSKNEEFINSHKQMHDELVESVTQQKETEISTLKQHHETLLASERKLNEEKLAQLVSQHEQQVNHHMQQIEHHKDTLNTKQDLFDGQCKELAEERKRLQDKLLKDHEFALKSQLEAFDSQVKVLEEDHKHKEEQLFTKYDEALETEKIRMQERINSALKDHHQSVLIIKEEHEDAYQTAIKEKNALFTAQEEAKEKIDTLQERVQYYKSLYEEADKNMRSTEQQHKEQINELHKEAEQYKSNMKDKLRTQEESYENLLSQEKVNSRERLEAIKDEHLSHLTTTRQGHGDELQTLKQTLESDYQALLSTTQEELRFKYEKDVANATTNYSTQIEELQDKLSNSIQEKKEQNEKEQRLQKRINVQEEEQTTLITSHEQARRTLIQDYEGMIEETRKRNEEKVSSLLLEAQKNALKAEKEADERLEKIQRQFYDALAEEKENMNKSAELRSQSLMDTIREENDAIVRNLKIEYSRKMNDLEARLEEVDISNKSTLNKQSNEKAVEMDSLHIDYTKKIALLQNALKAKEAELIQTREHHDYTLSTHKELHEDRLKNNVNVTKEMMASQHEEHIDQLKADFDRQKRELVKQHEYRINDHEKGMEKVRNSHETKLETLMNENAQLAEEIVGYEKQLESLSSELEESRSRLNSPEVRGKKSMQSQLMQLTDSGSRNGDGNGAQLTLEASPLRTQRIINAAKNMDSNKDPQSSHDENSGMSHAEQTLVMNGDMRLDDLYNGDGYSHSFEEENIIMQGHNYNEHGNGSGSGSGSGSGDGSGSGNGITSAEGGSLSDVDNDDDTEAEFVTALEHHRIQIQLQELEREYKALNRYMERIRESALHNVHLKYLEGHVKRRIHKFVEGWRDAHVWSFVPHSGKFTEKEKKSKGEKVSSGLSLMNLRF